MSAVFADGRSVITPLSDEVNATSWDGLAVRSVQLNYIYTLKTNELKLTWKRPKVIGNLQGYNLDLIELEKYVLF
jgi:hypothetical protein